MKNINNLVVKTLTSESSGYIIKTVRTTTVRSVLMTSPSLPSFHSEVSTRYQTKGLSGLQNIGNTCFLNSIIQCLSNTKPLLEYILKQEYINEIQNSARCLLTKRFCDLIINLWRDGKIVLSTSSLKSAVSLYAPRFSGFGQQDAQEFLRYLLQGLHEEINRAAVRQQKRGSPDRLQNERLTADETWQRYLKGDDSKIVDIFGGQLKSVLKCTTCGFTSTIYEPFWDLSLSIPPRDSVLGNKTNLNQCFDSFTKEETLDGHEKPVCSRCKIKQTCIKQISIQKFPQILVIHLKRFSGYADKVETEVQFPVSGLNLAPYSAEKQVSSYMYNLYGVVCHSGTCLFGHYTAYCKHPYGAGWHYFNDSRVDPANPDSMDKAQAYILFYESGVSEC